MVGGRKRRKKTLNNAQDPQTAKAWNLSLGKDYFVDDEIQNSGKA